jgi:thioesterase domain-containing protein/acyl carrier protein
LDFIRTHHIDVFECVPAQLKIMLTSGLMDVAEWQPRAIIFAGEAIDSATWAKICNSNQTLFYNAYGPTECTVYASVCCVNDSPQQPSIGKPLANIRLYVLDPFLHPQPPGVPGELYIGGACLARGYYNRPELTANVFINDPFLPGQAIYKTGDKVRFESDGKIVFLGRTDYQVKRFGYRIEPGEIEVVLAAYPGITATIVIPLENAQGDQDLIAYFTSEKGKVIRTIELRNWLKNRLPDYMVPQAFVLMDHFPLLENGKLDRKSLPALQTMENEPSDHHSPPQNYLENELAKIWAEILHLDQVGIDDDFFELGGYSMLAVQLFARIQHLSSQKLPIAAILTAPTIRKLTELIQQNTFYKYKYVVPIQSEGEKTPLFAVPGSPGDVYFCYHRLSGHLGKDRPLYGLQVNQLDEMIPSDLEGMAAFFIRQMKSIQPTGPYQIMGSSWGGHLVYAISSLLIAGGDEVAFSGLLDTRTSKLPFSHWFKMNVSQLVKLSPRKWLDFLNSGIKRMIKRSQSLSGAKKGQSPNIDDQIVARNISAVEKYDYKTYPQTLYFFKIKTGPAKVYKWGKYCKHLVTIEIPGTHASITQGPEAYDLAQTINQTLKSIEVKKFNASL